MSNFDLQRLNITHGYRPERTIAGPYPKTYDLRTLKYVTKVTVQNSTNCWAYAANSVLESHLLISGKTVLADNLYKFSPGHTTYAMYDMDPGKPDYQNTGGKKVVLDHTPKGDIYSYGGGANLALAYYTMGGGVFNAVDAPVSTGGNKWITPRRFAITQEKARQLLVTGAHYIADPVGHLPDDSFIREVKYYLMTYSAVGIGLDYNWNNMEEDASVMPHKMSYYCSNAKAKDAPHSVTIIGWDDGYAASNFKTPPPCDGAFLIKDSYKNTVKKEEVYDGYFWLSYADATIHSAYAITQVDQDFWQQPMVCLHHDIFGAMSTYGHSTIPARDATNFHCIFSAEDGDTLSGVGFFTSTPCLADIKVTSGTSSTTIASGHYADHAGYHYCPAQTPVSLAKGEFRVQITFKSAHSIMVFAPVEYHIKPDIYTNIEKHIAPNQCFIEGTDIVDIRKNKDPKYGNVPMRVFVKRGTADALKAKQAYDQLTEPITRGGYITDLAASAGGLPIEWRVEPYALEEYSAGGRLIKPFQVTVGGKTKMGAVNIHIKEFDGQLSAAVKSGAFVMRRLFTVTMDPAPKTCLFAASDVEKYKSETNLSGTFGVPGATVRAEANGLSPVIAKVGGDGKWSIDKFNIYDPKKKWEDRYKTSKINITIQDDNGLVFCTGEKTMKLEAPIIEKTDSSGKVIYVVFTLAGLLAAFAAFVAGTSIYTVEIAEEAAALELADLALQDLPANTEVQGGSAANPSHIKVRFQLFRRVKCLRNLVVKFQGNVHVDAIDGDLLGIVAQEITDGGQVVNCQVEGSCTADAGYNFGGIFGRGKNVTVKDCKVNLAVDCAGSTYNAIGCLLEDTCVLENVTVTGSLAGGTGGLAQSMQNAVLKNVSFRLDKKQQEE